MFSERALKEIKSEVCHKVSFSPALVAAGSHVTSTDRYLDLGTYLCVYIYNSILIHYCIFYMNMQIELELEKVLVYVGLK